MFSRVLTDPESRFRSSVPTSDGVLILPEVSARGGVFFGASPVESIPAAFRSESGTEVRGVSAAMDSETEAISMTQRCDVTSGVAVTFGK
jgi:hypothetical protein